MKKSIILFLSLLPFFTFGQDIKILKGNYSTPIYRESDGFLYALLDSNSLSYSRLVKINPQTGFIVEEKNLDFGYKGLWKSQGDTYFYAISGSKIYRYNFDIDDFDLTISFTPGYAPAAIVPLPDMPESIVVVWKEYGGLAQSIHIYDGATARPNSYYDQFGRTTRFAISDDNSILYGYNSRTSGSELSSFAISQAGLERSFYTYYYISNVTDFINYMDGRIYGSDGTVVNVDVFPAQQAGDLTLLEEGYEIEYHILDNTNDSDTIFTLATAGNTFALVEFDKSNFHLIKKENWKEFDGPILGTPIQFSNGGQIAFKTNFGLYLLTECTPTIPTAPALPEYSIFCRNDTFKLIAPVNYPDSQIIWSNGRIGKTYIDVYNGQSQSSPDYLSYKIMDSNGCQSTESGTTIHYNNITTTKPTFPSPDIYASNIICQGGYLDLHALESQNPLGFSYLWSTGDTTKTIRVTAPGGYSYKTIYKATGCSSLQSDTNYIVASNTPYPQKPTISVLSGNQDAILCSDESPLIAGPDSHTTYFWSDNRVTVQNSRDIEETVTLSLRVATDEYCLSEWSEPIKFEYYEVPPKPTILRLDNILASPNEIANQWYKNGIEITGSDIQYYNLTEPGIYTLRVGNHLGCLSELSDSVTK